MRGVCSKPHLVSMSIVPKPQEHLREKIDPEMVQAPGCCICDVLQLLREGLQTEHLERTNVKYSSGYGVNSGRGREFVHQRLKTRTLLVHPS